VLLNNNNNNNNNNNSYLKRPESTGRWPVAEAAQYRNIKSRGQ
jgi:hypothetical protein